ncbi:hypothetical protein [Mycobacterium sp. M26]|uniref:hypothetical protein n=1 Tax=Mycobacterium sp. M26 TaxID=1762962 RepID=UPI00073E1779|nr:hypothetical protein [Mycobacterium sp. M26]
MGRMSDEVMQHPLSLLWQNIFTWASWGIVLIMLVVAILMGLRQRTPFYVIALLAAGVAAFAEPLYDVAFDLWFYDAHADGTPGAAFSHFSAFGVVQPIWTHSGYIILYAAAPLYIGRRIYEGRLGRRGLFLVWGAEMSMSIAFEVIGTGTDVYTYYGPFVGRIWNYPAVIGVLEGTQTVLFTVVAVLVWRKVSTSWGLLSLFVVFPVTFFGANFGLGAPVIIALHLDDGLSTDALVAAATAVSISLCAFAVYGLSRFLPDGPVNEAPASAGNVEHRAGSIGEQQPQAVFR